MSFGKKEPETGIGVKRNNDFVNKQEFEQRIMRIAQSKRDIVWWAENFFHIVTLDGGLQKIKLYQKQKEMLKFLSDNTRIITLASRQTGKCVFKDSYVKVRNKKTGEIQEIKIIDLFNLVSNKNNNDLCKNSKK